METPTLTADSYRFIVEGTQAYALFFLDPTGTIVSWNPGAERIYGYTRPEILGQHFSILFTPEDRDASIPDIELKRAARAEACTDARWLLRKDGSRFWAEGACSAVHDGSGALIGFSKVTRDDTGGRRLEEALERTTDELQRFAYAVSHDLQEPVRVVKSYAELLSRRYKGQLDSEADEFIRFITDAASRMTALLQDVLAYSQAGRRDRMRLEPTPIANVLQWAIMNLTPLIKETGATITYDPAPTLQADQNQIAQLFQNLISNSIKFRGQDQPKIHVSAERLPDGMWRFSVRDNGIGIAPEYHERVFGVFKRLHGKDVPGTGIGLALCRKIVEAHRGRIWIESEEGKGTTVHFTLADE